MFLRASVEKYEAFVSGHWLPFAIRDTDAIIAFPWLLNARNSSNFSRAMANRIGAALDSLARDSFTENTATTPQGFTEELSPIRTVAVRMPYLVSYEIPQQNE